MKKRNYSYNSFSNMHTQMTLEDFEKELLKPPQYAKRPYPVSEFARIHLPYRLQLMELCVPTSETQWVYFNDENGERIRKKIQKFKTGVYSFQNYYNKPIGLDQHSTTKSFAGNNLFRMRLTKPLLEKLNYDRTIEHKRIQLYDKSNPDPFKDQEYLNKLTILSSNIQIRRVEQYVNE